MKLAYKLLKLGLRMVGFFFYYLAEFLKSNFILMIDILKFRTKITPAIVKLDLNSKTESEITLISSLIAITPGSITIAIKANPPTLYVHGMFVKDADQYRNSLSNLETKMLNAVRLDGFEKVSVNK